MMPLQHYLYHSPPFTFSSWYCSARIRIHLNMLLLMASVSVRLSYHCCWIDIISFISLFTLHAAAAPAPTLVDVAVASSRHIPSRQSGSGSKGFTDHWYYNSAISTVPIYIPHRAVTSSKCTAWRWHVVLPYRRDVRYPRHRALP